MNVTTIAFANETITAFTDIATNQFSSYVEPFVWIALGFLLAIVGQYIDNYALHTASGVWFLGLAVSSFLGITTLGFSFTLFFVLVGLAIFYQGIGGLIRVNNRRRTDIDES